MLDGYVRLLAFSKATKPCVYRKP